MGADDSSCFWPRVELGKLTRRGGTGRTLGKKSKVPVFLTSTTLISGSCHGPLTLKPPLSFPGDSKAVVIIQLGSLVYFRCLVNLLWYDVSRVQH
jgi:hypothetical protein